MNTRIELQSRINAAQDTLSAAMSDIDSFNKLAENNVFQSMEGADNWLENELANRAFDDCQGAHNCGEPEYRQALIVDGVEYVAIYTPEYDRHDKTYYYIDDSDFRIEKK